MYIIPGWTTTGSHHTWDFTCQRTATMTTARNNILIIIIILTSFYIITTAIKQRNNHSLTGTHTLTIRENPIKIIIIIILLNAHTERFWHEDKHLARHTILRTHVNYSRRTVVHVSIIIQFTLQQRTYQLHRKLPRSICNNRSKISRNNLLHHHHQNFPFIHNVCSPLALSAQKCETTSRQTIIIVITNQIIMQDWLIDYSFF